MIFKNDFHTFSFNKQSAYNVQGITEYPAASLSLCDLIQSDKQCVTMDLRANIPALCLFSNLGQDIYLHSLHAL